MSHRRYSTGFYFGKPDQYYENGGYLREYDVVAVVDACENGWMYATQKNKLSIGEEVEILSPRAKPVVMKIESLFDDEGNPVDSTPHPHMRFRIQTEVVVPPGSMIRKARKDGEDVYKRQLVN